MLVTILLLGFVFAATVTDLARHKIYNWTTYTGILTALGLSAAGLGLIPLSDSLLGLLACGLVMLVCFVLFKIGGGDVKLIAMLGAFPRLGRWDSCHAVDICARRVRGPDCAHLARWAGASARASAAAVLVDRAAAVVEPFDRRRAGPTATATLPGANRAGGGGYRAVFGTLNNVEYARWGGS